MSESLSLPIKGLQQTNGLWVSETSRRRHADFEKAYISARKKEKWFCPPEDLLQLPHVPRSHPHYSNWKKRASSLKRLSKQVRKETKTQPLRLLEVGCGNGWLAHQLAHIPNTQVVGQDINLTELNLAATTFQLPNLQWLCMDVMEDDFPERAFDRILFCASLQYFADVPAILKRCQALLQPQGSIYVMDTPVYASAKEAEKAQSNSANYYQHIEQPEMIPYYHALSWDDFKDFETTLLYTPPKGKLSTLLAPQASPFPWIRLASRH